MKYNVLEHDPYADRVLIGTYDSREEAQAVVEENNMYFVDVRWIEEE